MNMTDGKEDCRVKVDRVGVFEPRSLMFLPDDLRIRPI